jgi:hypothetical protein
MKKFISLILLFVLFTGILHSQTTVKVDLMKNSWLAINGTTNIIGFKLIHNGEKLLGKSITMNATQSQNKIYLSQNQLVIQVKNFSSNNPMALRDFMKLIKSDTYPTIKTQLNYIETSPGNEKDLYSKGNASVNITITGITKQYVIPVSSNKHGEYISVAGGKEISIRDFGLEPPIEMMGMIKVSEWININFNMNCKLTFNKEATLAQNAAN